MQIMKKENIWCLKVRAFENSGQESDSNLSTLERTAREKEINPELRVSSRRRPQSPVSNPHV
jgi:hypothetical protein